jgi:hypothetical protein
MNQFAGAGHPDDAVRPPDTPDRTIGEETGWHLLDSSSGSIQLACAPRILIEQQFDRTLV